MATFNLLLFPGDGIGPEVMAEVEKVTAFFSRAGLAHFEIEKGLVGGCAYDAHGKAISDADMARAGAADAVLLAAVGGPKWDGVPYEVRPEAGLLRLRKDLQLFANLRPAICYPALADASSLKREVVEGLDIMIVARTDRRASTSASPSRSSISATGRSAASTRRSTTPTRSSASVASPSISRASVAQQGHLVRKAQRHEVGRALERGGVGAAQARIIPTSCSSTSSPTRSACSSCAGPSSSTSSSPTICSATCCRTSPRCSPARSACCLRPRSATSIRRPASARRSMSPSMARRPISPARASPIRSR